VAERGRALRLALAALAALLPGCAGEGYEEAAAAPVARVEGPSAVLGGRLYVFGGFTHHDGRTLRATPRVDVYDPERGAWSQAAEMPAAITHRNPAADGDSVWFAGGFAGDHPGPAVAEVWRYEIAADRWQPGPPLPAPRAGGALARLGRTLHYVGGFGPDRRTTHGDHWALDLDAPQGWAPRAPLPCSRGHLAGVPLGGRLHAVGGQHGHDGPHPDLACHHAYLPDEDRWLERATLPSPRSHFEPGAFVWRERIVIVGGRNNRAGQPTLADVSLYDPARDAWSEARPLPLALLAPVAAPLEGRLFVTMGSRDDWRHPQAQSWLGPLP